MKQLRNLSHPNTVQVAATVQEEIGLRGAAVVYESTTPDIVINLEIGIAGDFPLLTSPKLSQEVLGEGPSIFVFDRSMIPNNNYVEWIIEQAEATISRTSLNRSQVTVRMRRCCNSLEQEFPR